MANKFKVGDKVIIKSVNDILGMYEGDEVEKVTKNLEDFSDFFNKVGTIRSFFGVVCMVDCGPNCERLIPSDWLEKYDFFNNNKRIINVCEEWDSEKFKPMKNAEYDNKKDEKYNNSKLLEELTEFKINEIREHVKNMTVDELKLFLQTCGDRLTDDALYIINEVIKRRSELDDISKNSLCVDESDESENEQREHLNNSINDGAKVINRLKEMKFLESSNEMYENTKKELESKRCCDSDKKIDGRIEMINNAQKDVISRYKKLIDNDSSCNFCFEEGRTDVADSTQSFDCSASTISDGILCRTNGIHEYFVENGRLMCHNFLVELPERYGIPCFNIDDFFIDRDNKTVSMTVYEKEDGEIIRKLISELRFGVNNTEMYPDEKDIYVYHYNNRLKIAYKEVFRNIKLGRVVDDALSYNGADEFFAHHVTFRYDTDFIEDNDFVPANASLIIEKHKKLNKK